jgi:hypothetical protein
MESILNLAWALLAVVCVCLWMRVERRTGAERRLPIIALLMLIVMLFPVISVSDDLWSIQNPAETDTCQRRDYLASCPHSIFPELATLPEPAFTILGFGLENLVSSLNLQIFAVTIPALTRIQNRPPPAA